MKFRAISAVVAGAMLCGAGHAETVNQSFTVTANLAPKCRAASSNGTPTLAFGTYTAFDTQQVSAPSVNIKFECSRGMTSSLSLAFDASGSLATSDGGVIAGLRYTLSASGPTRTSGTAATAGASGVDGTPDILETNINGSIAGGQAGCASGTSECSASQQRTLTLTF